MGKIPTRFPRSRSEKPKSRNSDLGSHTGNIENFTKERVARRDLGNSPVDRAHIKTP